MFKKILVANDGSDCARRALATAVELAGFYGADLYMISVEEHLPHYAATVGEVLEEQAEEDSYFAGVVKDAKEVAAAHGVKLRTLVTPGHEVETVIGYAAENQFDLLVFGFMGHSKVMGRVMGGSATNLTRISPCSVMVIK
jgi:nucleotide-binding universal stress UspA family protein